MYVLFNGSQAYRQRFCNSFRNRAMKFMLILYVFYIFYWTTLSQWAVYFLAHRGDCSSSVTMASSCSNTVLVCSRFPHSDEIQRHDALWHLRQLKSPTRLLMHSIVASLVQSLYGYPHRYCPKIVLNGTIIRGFCHPERIGSCHEVESSFPLKSW